MTTLLSSALRAKQLSGSVCRSLALGDSRRWRRGHLLQRPHGSSSSWSPGAALHSPRHGLRRVHRPKQRPLPHKLRLLFSQPHLPSAGRSFSHMASVLTPLLQIISYPTVIRSGADSLKWSLWFFYDMWFLFKAFINFRTNVWAFWRGQVEEILLQ